MLYKLIHSLSDEVSALNVFRYITFRTFLSFLTAFFFSLLIGPSFIKNLVKKQMKQSIRDDGPQSHKSKSGTPTMGGLLIISTIVLTSLLWMDLSNPYVLATIILTLFFGLIGYMDDFLKVSKKNTKGLSGKLRLCLEFFISSAILYWLISAHNFSTVLYLPIFKHISINLGWGYIVFGSIVIVGCANAVNLTDGLDGLAIVPVTVCAVTFMLFGYVAGNSTIAGYLQIPFINGVGELAPLAGAVVAAGLGFLWFNSYPATVFMGDVGSLSLGGLLGIFAVLTKNELILVILGGVFVVEALSVITQVASFKLTGKRVFKMAPIHHHYELKGIDEPKVIVRFWIISIILAVICLSTLKLR